MINSTSKINNYYTGQPKEKYELRRIIRGILEKDKDADLNGIDVSQINDMSYLFYFLDPHNINISEWDVSNVTRMDNMFRGCKSLKNEPSWYKG